MEELPEEDIETLRYWIARHAEETRSPLANRILDHWHDSLRNFVKVFPRDYKRVLGIELNEPVLKVAAHG